MYMQLWPRIIDFLYWFIFQLYYFRWMYAKALPGANRLIKHLYDHGIPLALASNSLREYIDLKISHQKGWLFLYFSDISKKKRRSDVIIFPLLSFSYDHR